MFTPPNSNPFPGSYDDLLKRLTQRILQSEVNDQITTLLQQTFERELAKENMVLSRPERVRLYQQSAKAILTDILSKISN